MERLLLGRFGALGGLFEDEKRIVSQLSRGLGPYALGIVLKELVGSASFAFERELASLSSSSPDACEDTEDAMDLASPRPEQRPDARGPRPNQNRIIFPRGKNVCTPGARYVSRDVSAHL